MGKGIKEKKSQRYYVTTPIYYANAHPHLGSTYTTALADTLTRFHASYGAETFCLTGTDEHGDKVQQAADAVGKTPYEFTTEVSDVFKATWKELDLRYSRFIRTTDEDHKQTVKSILQKIYDQGDIYFGEYGGLYCLGCERFLTEKELVDGKCPDHQVEPKFVSEKNYFFRMSKYQDQLLHHLTEVAPDMIRPERYKNEVLALLREPLEDLCISRPKSRLTWGIQLPFDENYVTYVWFDALINYLTGIGYPDGENFDDYWSNCEHLIAKDILKPHGVFWPTMLLAAGIPLYKHLTVHGYWITPTGKMSKSLGNVVDPIAIKNQFGMDVFRYFVFREMAFGLDGTFSQESLETRYNADLANNLGNLVSRTLAMVHRYRGGVVPSLSAEGEAEKVLHKNALTCASDISALIEKMEVNRALERLWQLIDAGNVYVDRTRPWELAKDENQASALDTALYCQLELIRIVASHLTAFMPETSRRILIFLGYNEEALLEEQKVSAASEWGRLSSGVKVAKGEVLFPRLEKKKTPGEQAAQQTVQKNQKIKKEGRKKVDEGMVSYSDFSKVELRVGQILEAERVEKSEKLIRLQVDLGAALGKRQIVAGIAPWYETDSLIGRKAVVVSNLKPAKLMGIESQGMLLAASDEDNNLELLSVGDILPPGSQIK